MLTLSTPITKYSRIPKTYATKLKKLNIKTLGDLVYHIPHRYDDFSDIVNISDLEEDKFVTIKGKVIDISMRHARRRRGFSIITAVVEDESGACKLVWFNQQFIMQSIRRGVTAYFSGKVKLDQDGLMLSTPKYELTKSGGIDNQVHTARLVPVYHETAGVSSKWLRFIIKPILETLVDQQKEFLPAQMRKDLELMTLDEALLNIHFPETNADAQQAKRRLTIQEIFLTQLNFFTAKFSRQQDKTYKIKFDKEVTKKFVDSLPFKLTDDQKISSWEILQDMEKDKNGPMNRLLEGDVGAGKTVVAAMAALNTVANGKQAAIVAPTEILARQHYEGFVKLFEGTGYTVVLLTSNQYDVTSPPAPLLNKERGAIDNKFNRQIHNIPELKVTRRKLRKNQTKAEKMLWDSLRNKKLGGYKFKRQHSIASFIPDFYCPEKKLAIELDGEYHEHIDIKEYDAAKMEVLKEYHIKILRLKNTDIQNNLNKIKENILSTLKELPDAVPLLVKEGPGEVKKIISSPTPLIAIGTHALLQDSVNFKNLALLVIDEQHRFGVAQRAKLTKAKIRPHLLTMSATPIPRTLALTVYGDLEISRLKTKPSGRKPIITKVVAPANRTKANDFIRKQVADGRQAFVICPLIEESDLLEVKSVTQEYERLRKTIFPNISIGMLHGKMKPKEKDQAMQDFISKKTMILVSTSVVEVGVDVPNATIMLIEDAERFGLAQIHQFRGRVGRSSHQSYCLIFTESTSAKSNQRLKALEKATNGFDLAEIDLKLRGPGEFCGTQQSGIPDLTMQNINNTELITESRTWAKKVLEESADLEKYPRLKAKFESFRKEIHLE